MARDSHDTALLFRVRDAQADTQLVAGGGWERAIQYRLSIVSPEEAEGGAAPSEPTPEATLRIEYLEGLDPNPNSGKLFLDEAIDGEGTMMYLFMPAPLAAVEALIRDAETECPRAVVVFTAPPRRRTTRQGTRSARGARVESEDDAIPITRVLLTTSLAEAYEAGSQPPAAP